MESSKYYKKIVGEKCYLSPMALEDAPYFTEWLNDAEVAMNLNIMEQVINLETEQDFLKKLSAGYNFSIIDVKTNKLIGNTGLINVDLIQRRAEFGIFIGTKNFRDRGYGTEATRLMLDFAFNVLNLYHIHLGVFSFNARAMKCYEKAGFHTIGRFTKARQLGGERYDIVLMEILADEFESPYVTKTFDIVKSFRDKV